uniref:Spatacsin C-terminal domain-containing protein n=1 Tax=Ananas comosus var. bracteatus TaxID=296719 RepID=A0A6V7NU69_ANACO|nr:unnamed protein product [Ananas comosus var. bracteatus]
MRGKWVDWGPSQDTKLSNPSQKKYFRTFVTEISASVSNGDYLARFPPSSLFPDFAEVVSFSIYNSILSFLEFCAGTDPPVGNRKTESAECSRVFASSSHRFIGLVLTLRENVLINSDDNLNNSSKNLVVVMKLYQWGVKWLFSVNLQDLYPGSPSSEWVDYQFSDNFLICLNTSGLICICDVNSGSTVSCFDASQNCIVPAYPRKFKRLIVASYYPLLAIVDEHGVIYVLSADDIIPGNHPLLHKSPSTFTHSNCGILAFWKVAGHEIGGTKQYIQSKESQPDNFISGFTGGSHLKDGRNSLSGSERAYNPLRRGCLYLITKDGLSVTLPSVPISSSAFPEAVRYWQPNIASDNAKEAKNLVSVKESAETWRPWQIEVLDRVLLYEGPEEADRFVRRMVRWSLKIARIRQMQLALQYLKSDEIEQCLNMLVDINLAEEGVLRLLFTSVYQIFCRTGSENEVAVASRLMSLASRFATKMVRRYGLLKNKKGKCCVNYEVSEGIEVIGRSNLFNVNLDEVDNSRKLCEMAYFLEVIRDIQGRVAAKSKKLVLELADGGDATNMAEKELSQDDSLLPVVIADTASLHAVESHNMQDATPTNLALTPAKSAMNLVNFSDFHETAEDLRKKMILENTKDMIRRWEIDNFDLKTVVKDALHSGRLPLAVLQLHLLRQKESVSEKESQDTFSEVREVGRSLAYDLFIKGESGLALATLERLGDDIETVLRQLLFGTVRRSLRARWKILERISLIERLYPSSSFWGTYNGKQKLIREAASKVASTKADRTSLVLHVYDNTIIECGDIDGAVIGCWANVDSTIAPSEVCEDDAHSGYWACAAVWSDSWDSRTVDRVNSAGSTFSYGNPHTLESQFEYHSSHNNKDELYKLLDIVPSSSLSEEILKVNLDDSYPSATNIETDTRMYICAAEELESIYMDIPHVKILKSPASYACSSWLKELLEQEFAKKYIFLKEYWKSIAEFVALLARAGLIIGSSIISSRSESSNSSLDLDVLSKEDHKDTTEAVHKLVLHYCTRYNLPHFLDLYLDHHNLVQNFESLCLLKEAAGDCEWLSGFFSRGNDEMIPTIDYMAKEEGAIAALATLMYAASPIQKCLCSGSVNGNASSSFQCTLENLRSGLQKYPTLWRTLVSSCFGRDAYGSLISNANNVYEKPSFTDYLNWRYSNFSSTGGDLSLTQMLPFWFSNSIRRLLKLFVQGPSGWQSPDAIKSGVNAISWEASIQKSIEEELYSSLQDKGFKVEHYLHRGQALAAFNHLLSVRALSLKSANARQELSAQPNNIHLDVQKILTALSQTEVSVVQSVLPLAITHFEDYTLVASCIFLLELCGLSTNMLRLDITALRRISSYNKSANMAVPGSDITLSLAHSLAEDYICHDYLRLLEQPVSSQSSKGKQQQQQPSRPLISVLHHLEKASLPLINEGKSCGSWLLTGVGDGSLFRSEQKKASHHWSLVTEFCTMHQLPLSTKYLALLANDNDWVGFLSEAQLSGFSTDVIIRVASEEIRDPRLKMHILTVLRSMQSTRKKANSSANLASLGNSEAFLLVDGPNNLSMELFAIIAECEKQKYPGGALLNKAKNMRWPFLAIVASCFPDVSPLSSLIVWLEITAARETSSIKVDDIFSKITSNVGAAIKATNKALPTESQRIAFHYNRKNPKRRRFSEPTLEKPIVIDSSKASTDQEVIVEEERKELIVEQSRVVGDNDEGLASLSNMVAVLCQEHLFLPLLRAFEMFLPSCTLVPFIRSLQAFSQMRLSEASAHLLSFSGRIRDDLHSAQTNTARDGVVNVAWIITTSVKAANSMLSTCPSAYEQRCLLQLLAAADFGDGGSSAAYFRRLYWKINLSEPSLSDYDYGFVGSDTADDFSLLMALERNGRWEQARNWAKQLDSSNSSSKSAVHHVTESQAEAMVAEWKEFLWDVPQERAALWGYCQALFVRYSFPALQAGLFFLKHAEAVEKEIPARELHEMLLLSLQWLSGTITQSAPVYPLNLLREIETRVWLLAVEAEAQSKAEADFTPPNSLQNLVVRNATSIIEQTANIITKMDNNINNVTRMKATDRNGTKENNVSHQIAANISRMKRRGKPYLPLRRHVDNDDSINDSDDFSYSPQNSRTNAEISRHLALQEESEKIEDSVSGWEQNVRPVDMERAVLSLLEFGQISAAKQLQQKLSPTHVPLELVLIDVALKIATLSSSSSSGEISLKVLDREALSIIRSLNVPDSNNMIDPTQALELLAAKCGEGCGRGLCRRIIAVVKAAKVLGLSFYEAFEKQPIELLQLLSLKAQDSLEEAKLLVQTHTMPAPSIARILAESFLKGLLAAHRGGYMDSQKEEGPAPLLWRFSDFLKWAELCPSGPEIGHALMRLVMTGQEIPHACEVELLILSHHYYHSSACLDGVDVLITLAANKVESYVLEGDFSCLARLITGASNFHALNFVLNILIENGQLELLLQKYSAADATTGAAAAVRGFRMVVLSSLKLFNPDDLDAFAMVYNHFDMKHEAASLLEYRAALYMNHWSSLCEKDRENTELIEAMRHLIEAAEVLSTIDAGHRTHRACALASLLSIQIRIPDIQWINLSDTNARRVLVDQSRFQEALIVAEAYALNQPSEWAPVFWNQMLKPDLIERFVAEFVAGDQSHFSVWLSPGGLPAEWMKHLARSFRSLLKRTRDLRLRVQLSTIATGFGDVIDSCTKVLDKVPRECRPSNFAEGPWRSISSSYKYAKNDWNYQGSSLHTTNAIPCNEN